jgi:hypothetical protein
MNPAEPARLGDMRIVARYLTPTEAYMSCSCLQAAGVPAAGGDVHLVQMHSLLVSAEGGACIRESRTFVVEVKSVIATVVSFPDCLG